MILLNTTSWSCSLTRKTNLTYFEAVQSEKEAEKELIEFPESLELPILFITHKYTNRGRFEELVNDIYHIMKDRFFMNEEVTFNDKNRKMTARILTSYCTQQQILDGNRMEVEIGHEIKEPLLPGADSYRYTIQIIDGNIPEEERFREQISNEKLFRSKNVGARQKIRLFLKNSCHMPQDGVRYTIHDALIPKVDNLWWSDVMSGSEPMCPQTPVLQRGRIPNLLKNGGGGGENGEIIGEGGERKEKTPKREKKDPNAPPRPRGRPPKTPEQRALTQQEKKQRKRAEASTQPDDFDLTSSGALTFHPNPSTSSSPVKKKIRRSSISSKNEKKKKAKIIEQQGDLDFYFTEAKRLGIDLTGLEQDDKLLSPKKVAEFKMRVKEEKDVEREALKEEKKRKIREKAAYNKKREDLLCNDLKPMPKFSRLEIPEWMTDEEFGDFLFIMQFFSTFKEILPLKEIRGNDEIQFSDIVIAVKCHDPQNSPFADLMRVLLSIRTDIADEEDGDEADINNRDEMYLINTQNCDPANVVHGESIRDISETHFKIRKIHGKSVRHLPVDWMTLTEVLRLIFATSGYYTGISTHRHRLYARGNYRGYEDPAFEFRNAHPDIMEKLRTQTVFDLEQNERLEIIKTLIYQLLTYSKFRIHLEKHQVELTELKREQKKLKTWDAGQEGEANASRLLLEMDSGDVKEEKEKDPMVKRFKGHLKALNEGRRYDKEDLDTILLDAVPYSSLTLDEIVTARDLQKTEFSSLMQSITSKLFSTYCKVSDIRLGSDRAYRRFIVIDNLSAILIENPTSSELRIECDEPSILNPSEGDSESSHDVFRCTGNLETCEVHGTARDLKTRNRWFYIKNRRQFDEFVNSLNPRGIRENEMLEELTQYRQNLLELLEDSEAAQKDGTWHEALMTEQPDPEDSYNIDWDTEIRDLLLDFEKKLDEGQMGSVEKKFRISRSDWCENLKKNGDVSGVLKENLKIYEEDVVELEDVKEMSDAKKLAIAFFMIVRSIQLKFIKPPFISPNRDEHGNLKPSELFIRWQRALLLADSHSAVVLFISTFEGSIKWDKSRLQGKCKSCRRKAVAHELILCSECDNCYHLKCAKLQEPEDDWMCSNCRAQHRKTENEAKRMAREDEISLNNISINETLDLSESQNSEIPTTSSAATSESVIKTASGRTVKKVHYSEVHEGLSLKSSRKSNGMVVTSTPTPTTPSERPQRNVSMRNYDTDNENNHSDEDDGNSDGENTRKRKIPSSSSKKTSFIDSPRVIIPTAKEKMSSIETLLKEAMRQECSWPFLQPVDPKEVPDYYDVIERPMDLRTMMNKIKQRIYNKPAEIRVDFEQILTNCETYNETESEIYQLSRELQDFVTDRLDAIIDT